MIEENEQIQKENSELRMRIEGLKSEISRLRNEKKMEQTKQKLTYSKELDEMTFKINSLEDYIESSKGRLIHLESEKTKDEQLIEQYKAEIEAHKKEIQSNLNEISKINQDLNSKIEQIKLNN